MSIFEEEQYEGNPEKEEPKKEKRKIIETKFTSPSPGDGLINVEKSQELLNDLTFVVMKLEEAGKEIKSIKHLSQIKEHVENLQNITVDTSNFEKQFQAEIKKLTKKIESIVDNADLHELDEISDNIKKINKTFKRHRYLSIFLISIFAFAAGYLTYSFYPIQIKNNEVERIANKAKEKGVVFKKHKRNDIIAIPTKSIKSNMSKNGKFIIYTIK